MIRAGFVVGGFRFGRVRCGVADLILRRFRRIGFARDFD